MTDKLDQTSKEELKKKKKNVQKLCSANSCSSESVVFIGTAVKRILWNVRAKRRTKEKKSKIEKLFQLVCRVL